MLRHRIRAQRRMREVAIAEVILSLKIRYALDKTGFEGIFNHTFTGEIGSLINRTLKIVVSYVV